MTTEQYEVSVTSLHFSPANFISLAGKHRLFVLKLSHKSTLSGCQNTYERVDLCIVI